MMTADEMRAYRNEKIQDLYKDAKYKSLLEHIEQKMIDEINKNPNTYTFTFHLPDDIIPSIIIDRLRSAGYGEKYNKDNRDISIFLNKN